jgi:hypothetical protein
MLTLATSKAQETVMESIARRIRRAIVFLWQTSEPMTFVGLLMIAALGAALVGLVVDGRTITGMPAWLKPAKFAASTAIYSLTLAWIFSYLPTWTATRRWVGWLTAAIFVGEVTLINLQAWRGTSSHFNIGTPFDAAIFGMMGLGILVQTISSIFVVIALWRQRFGDDALAWALRLGMTITLLGAATGPLMTQPTAAQLAEARVTHRMPVAGAHSVGGPDGGPGLPGTGWSREHGDLRVAHFLGLHAVQVLAILAVAIGRVRPRAATPATIGLAAASYVALFGIILWQALRGESIVAPGALTLTALAVWLGATALMAYAAVGRRPDRSAAAAALIA